MTGKGRGTSGESASEADKDWKVVGIQGLDGGPVRVESDVRGGK